MIEVPNLEPVTVSVGVTASGHQPPWCQDYCGLLLLCVTVHVTESGCQHPSSTVDAPSLFLDVTVSFIASLILGLLSL